MIILKGEFVDKKPGSYINKNNERVDYLDVMVKVGNMKFETVRVPADYPLNIKDGLLTFETSGKYSFGYTAKKYNQVTKQFEYTPISFYISKAN